MVAEVKVGAEGRAFIEQSLSEGNTLARTVAQFQQLEHGGIVALLSPELSSQTVNDFEVGFTGVQGAWEYLAGRILQYIKEEGHIVVIEDAYAFASDELRYRPIGQTVLFYEQEVYHVIDGTYSDVNSIIDVLSKAAGYPTVGFFVALPKSFVLPSWYGSLEAAHLDILANNVEHILVSAYDNESWVIWRANE